MRNGVYKYERGMIREFICHRLYSKDVLTKKAREAVEKHGRIVYIQDGCIEIIVTKKGEQPSFPDTYELFIE